ncbi:MAG TPA: nuclear transport factor 2 family protein [Steroidobacteraceae bacterium]|nr:nuclear transport factor 2 family protein [Steroidobacteraceae bacterium]
MSGDTSLQTELRELLDKQAIAELLYAYAEGIDRRDQKLLERVFTKDCRLHYGAYDHPATVLIDSWRADLPSAFLMTHHLYGNIVVRFHGADRARSITYFFAHHRTDHGGKTMDEMVRGRYLDRLIKQDGAWRFAERTIVFDWSKISPADPTNWWDAPGNPAKVGAHGREDPAWGFLDPAAPW